MPALCPCANGVHRDGARRGLGLHPFLQGCREPILHSTPRAQLLEQTVLSSSITMSNVDFASECATLAEEILNISLERMQKRVESLLEKQETK